MVLFNIIFIISFLILGVGALMLIWRNLDDINKLNNPKTILKDLHPELENVQPGDELMTVNFGEENEEDPLYKSLKNRINELNDELDDEEEDEDEEFDRGPSLDIAGIRNNPYNFLGRRFVADGGIMRVGLKDGVTKDGMFRMKRDGFLMSPDFDNMTEEQKMYMEGMKIQEKMKQEALKKFLDKLKESMPENERNIRPVPMPTYGPDDFKKGLRP